MTPADSVTQERPGGILRPVETSRGRLSDATAAICLEQVGEVGQVRVPRSLRERAEDLLQVVLVALRGLQARQPPLDVDCLVLLACGADRVELPGQVVPQDLEQPAPVGRNVADQLPVRGLAPQVPQHRAELLREPTRRDPGPADDADLATVQPDVDRERVRVALSREGEHAVEDLCADHAILSLIAGRSISPASTSSTRRPSFILSVSRLISVSDSTRTTFSCR